jgi:hypothetical protein
MAAPNVAEATKGLNDGTTRLDRAIQIVREPEADGDPERSHRSTPPPREQIRGHEQALHDWLKVARRWLEVVGAHLVGTAGKPLVKGESNALWTGTTRLRSAFLTHIFALDSTLADVSDDLYEGAEMRHSPIEAAYRNLFLELEPYRALDRILAQELAWKSSQSPTEIRATLRQRAADAEAIRDRFEDYRLLADAILSQVDDLLSEE